MKVYHKFADVPTKERYTFIPEGIYTLYHGTSDVFLDAIKEQGLKPSTSGQYSVSDIPETKKDLLWLGDNKELALNHASKKAESVGGNPVILVVDLDTSEIGLHKSLAKGYYTTHEVIPFSMIDVVRAGERVAYTTELDVAPILKVYRMIDQGRQELIRNKDLDAAIMEVLEFYKGYLYGYEAGYMDDPERTGEAGEKTEYELYEDFKKRNSELEDALRSDDAEIKIVALDTAINQVHVDFTVLEHISAFHHELGKELIEALESIRGKRAAGVFRHFQYQSKRASALRLALMPSLDKDIPGKERKTPPTKNWEHIFPFILRYPHLDTQNKSLKQIVHEIRDLMRKNPGGSYYEYNPAKGVGTSQPLTGPAWDGPDMVYSSRK